MYKLKQPLVRVGLWFVSFLLADACFSLLWGGYSVRTFTAFLIFTALFACPAWCLYLPVVIAFKNAEKRRIWILLGAGILVGPLSFVLWHLAAGLRRANAPLLRLGDPIGGGGIFMLFAVTVGSLTTCAYIYSLKILHRRAGHAKCD